MKKVFISIFLISIVGLAKAQSTEFDSVLAKKLGADELGMKSYILVILKTGSANITDSATRAQLFRGHFDNMNKLAEEGKLVVAGPINANEQNYRGIFLFNVDNVSEAKELLKGDPTVVQQIFEPLFFQFYGSAALQELPELHKRIQKKEL